VSDVLVRLTAAELGLMEHYATEKLASFASVGGGRSQFRGADRQATVSEDGMTGMAANLAGCKWLLGTALGRFSFCASRWAAGRAPHNGDKGCDVPGSNIDFKATLMRTALPFDGYHLPVRPKERHPGAVYVYILVEEGFQACHIVGWASDEELPAEPEAEGVFKGAYLQRRHLLHPIPPFHWTL